MTLGPQYYRSSVEDILPMAGTNIGGCGDDGMPLPGRVEGEDSAKYKTASAPYLIMTYRPLGRYP